MSRSEGSASILKFQVRRRAAQWLCLVALLALLPAASIAQDFTLSAPTLNPEAVAPGGTSSANITIVTNSGFSGSVNLSCTVTPNVQITSTDFPTCVVSPTSLSASGGASATISTTTQTPQISYTVTITGTDGSGTQTSQLTLTVLSVTPQFTITVASAVSPSSVVAGTGAEGTVTVNPLDGYVTPLNGYITLYCSSITPLVTIPPVCSFTYPTGQKGITLTGNTPQSATISISTFGPVTTGSTRGRANLYALWVPIPFLAIALIGVATGRKRTRRAWGLLSFFVLTALILLAPACSNTGSPTKSTPNGVTPANAYTFTIIGVDTNGVVSSNTGTTNSGPTVSLTVTAPK